VEDSTSQRITDNRPDYRSENGAELNIASPDAICFIPDMATTVLWIDLLESGSQCFISIRKGNKSCGIILVVASCARMIIP